ncbi:MAG: spore cortex-lytic enzyme [Clostridia bacterium]|nr:spore cortex-lytic enzyme [Clostridia bacterium]
MQFKKIYRISISAILILTLAFTALYTNYTQSYNEGSAIHALSKLGSRGDEVRRIQKKLKELGFYNGSIDGIYGSATKKAVIAFQKNCGITADGVVGTKTLKFLGLEASSSSSGKYSQSDIELLAKLIAAEARGENYVGQVAVGAVVLNRVAHASFPDSVAGVIYQKGAFSCINDSNWNIAATETSRKAAQDCINGWDPSGGAVFYFNPKKTNDSFMRSRPVITVIGNHTFCN